MKTMQRVSILSVLALVLAWIAAPASASADQVQYQGRWQKKTYAVSGSWKIVEQGGKRYLAISSDFRTANGPDLKVFLSPLSAKSLTSGNGLRNARKLAVLPKTRGAQRIEIPAGVDLKKYQSVHIYCEKYTKLFAASALVR